jgi:hypothetical protein
MWTEGGLGRLYGNGLRDALMLGIGEILAIVVER